MKTTTSNKVLAVIAVILGVLTATVPTYLLFQAVTYLFLIPLFLGILSLSLGIAALRHDPALGKLAAGVAFVLLLVAVVVPFGLIAYHNRSGSPIVLIIPDNYRGPVVLVIDKDQGVDVPLVNGAYEYRIPRSGKLLIQDDGPFRQWHATKAMYASGQAIPIDYAGDMPSGVILLHLLGSGSKTENRITEEIMEFLVGTQADLKNYLGQH